MTMTRLDFSPSAYLEPAENIKINGILEKLANGVQFNGRDTGIWLLDRSFQNISTFVVDVQFQPFRDGPAEQRFFHIQDQASENRFLLETRVTSDGYWYADTFFAQGEQSVVLQDYRLLHPCDKQYRYTAIYDGTSLSQYINQQMELKEKLPGLKLPNSATVSIGIRASNEYPFLGIINSIFFHPNCSAFAFT